MPITRKDNVLDHVRDKTPSVSDGVASLPAKEFVIPGVLGLAGALAAKKAPDIVRGITGALEQRSEDEAQDLGRKAMEGAKGALTNGGGDPKKTRRLPIQRWTDVAVPVDRAYQAWTKFDQFPQFMHRVLSVEQNGRDKISWQEKIWFSKRQWKGQITERRKNDRIVWKTTSGMAHKGIVSFHKLDDNLTRVMVDIEFEPSGMVEKMASGLRFVKRAVQSDLARFKAFVEMDDAKGIEYRSPDETRSRSGRQRDSARRDREDGRKRRRNGSANR